MMVNDYYSNLSGPAKARYTEKVHLCGFDPYSLKKSEYSEDSTHLPAVEYPDIVNYLVLQTSWATKKQMKAYKSMDAYNFFISGWVNSLLTKQVENDKAVVFARVNHSQRARETPLKTWFLAEKDGNVIAAHCDCMAGLSEGCSHVGALLFAVETAVRMRGSLTCTQEKSKWVMPGYVKQIPYIPVCEMDFCSSKTKHKLLLEQQKTPSASLPATPNLTPNRTLFTSNEEQRHFFQNIAGCSTKPAILALVPDLNDIYVPKDNTSLPKRMGTLFNQENMNMSINDVLVKCEEVVLTLTDTECKAVELQTRKQSSSSEWFQQREGRITASRFRAACHTNPGKPAKSLIKAICYPQAHKFSSEATRWGNAMEAKARDKYQDVMKETHEGLTIFDSGLHLNPKWPFMGASPDGIVDCKCCGKGCLEIKCPFSQKDSTVTEALGRRNFCLQRTNDGVRLNKNHAYYHLVQMQIFVAGTDFCDFIVWTPNDIHIERIMPDYDLWHKAVPKATLFFNKCILPELVGKCFTRASASESLSVNMHEESEDDEEDGIWCFCQQYIPDSQLIGCDNDSCQVQWYHIACLALSSEPEGSWICPTCQSSM